MNRCEILAGIGCFPSHMRRGEGRAQVIYDPLETDPQPKTGSLAGKSNIFYCICLAGIWEQQASE